MTQLISFTVIIPVYNGSLYLAETIENILAQTHPPSEVIIIDDGSPRSSAAVAARFTGRIRYIFRTNQGVSATRNYGASLATTEWLSFCDQDDLWTLDHLARQAAAIVESERPNTPAADICYSGRRLLVRPDDSGAWQLGDPIMPPSPTDLPHVLLSRCPITPSAVSIRRSTFLDLSGFCSEHDFCEDWDLWLRLQRHGARFVRVTEPTMHYRVLATGNSHNPLPIFRANLGVVRDSILPFLSLWRRATHGRKVHSRLESEAAILLRQTRRPGALRMMLRSLIRYPFHQPRRYKIATHMLFFRRHPQ